MITQDTRIIDLTVGQLKDVISDAMSKARDCKPVDEVKITKGAKVIQAIFECNKNKALKIAEDSKYSEAISRDGKYILVNETKLKELRAKYYPCLNP